MARLAAHGWTIPMALDQFAAAGKPVDPARFRIAVTRVARLQRIGEMPSGRKGGRGLILYDIGQLQLLHKDVAKWIPAQDGDHDRAASER